MDSTHVSATSAPAPLRRTQHFWVSSYPFFESSLIITPTAEPRGPEASCAVQVFDADGECINEVALEFPSTEIYSLELDPLLGGCKLESGMKHAHVVVRTDEGMDVSLRIYSKEAAAFVGEPARISSTQGTFFPMTFSSDRANLLCCINTGDEEATLRCRLFFGKRSPESSWVIPPRASRVMNLESEFRQYTALHEGDQVQAYIRLSVKAGNLAVQAIERTEGPKDSGFYTSVS